MKKLFPKSLLAIALCCSAGIRVSAQQRDTLPVPVTTQPDLPAALGNPQQYEIAEIAVTGTQFLDKALLISLSGLNVGDKVVYPGGDQFAKAIQTLWGQRLFANVAIYVTKIEDGKIWLEINLTERPRLANFIFRGIKKSEAEDMAKKSGLRKGSVITESMKQNTIAVIRKNYEEKGFRNVVTTVTERKDTSQVNAADVIFTVSKGGKVKINDINIVDNSNISDSKIKKKMKGTRERTRFTLHPDKEQVYQDTSHVQSDYWSSFGFLVPSRTLEELDPYFRFKLFTSAKFNETKYAEDKEKVISYYNSQGYRDAQIVNDTTYKTKAGGLNVDM